MTYSVAIIIRLRYIILFTTQILSQKDSSVGNNFYIVFIDVSILFLIWSNFEHLSAHVFSYTLFIFVYLQINFYIVCIYIVCIGRISILFLIWSTFEHLPALSSSSFICVYTFKYLHVQAVFDHSSIFFHNNLTLITINYINYIIYLCFIYTLNKQMFVIANYIRWASLSIIHVFA